MDQIETPYQIKQEEKVEEQQEEIDPVKLQEELELAKLNAEKEYERLKEIE